MRSLQPLLDAVRKACLPGLWSEGVRLSRDGKVLVGPEADCFRVRAPGYGVAPTVTLYPDDAEWSCDCGGRLDPCAHVAAAVIFAAQGGAAALPTEEAKVPAAPKLVYRLGRRDRVLTLRRFIVHPDGREARLAGSLS